MSIGIGISMALGGGGRWPTYTPDGTELMLKTTSTSATWTPVTVTKSGDALTWYLIAESGYLIDTQVIDKPTFDLSALPGEKTMYAHSSDGWSGFTSFHCNTLLVTELDVSNCTALTTLICYINSLTELDVSTNTVLEYLRCNSTGLTALDVSANTALTTLYCYSNSLTALDVSANTALTYLSCSLNSLTALDVSANTALMTLLCSANSLTALDVSTNTDLTHLNCRDNSLTALDVSTNTALTELHCYSNSLTSGEIDDILIDLAAEGDASGTLNYETQSPAANPTSASYAAYQTLDGLGWTITGTEPPAS